MLSVTLDRPDERLEIDMNTAELEVLRDSALTLPELERAKLASDLVASLDGPKDIGVESAWDIEICRRVNEIEKGKVVLLDAEEVLAKARARLKR